MKKEEKLNEILNYYKKEDIKQFLNDFFLVAKVFRTISLDYNKKRNTESDIDTFITLLTKWEQKYEDIILKFVIDDFECFLEIYFKEDNVKSAIGALKKITGFVTCDKYDDSVSSVVIEAIYMIEEEEHIVTLRQERNGLRLIYEEEDILDVETPHMLLCAYFALRFGYNESIDILDFKERFSFEF